ncbi:FKBP-type peptidyl-prolyl cis-trans isomerase [Sphingomicrobium flavum]|uniref:FKBP-type peptidyl-prolyl cis-trans isomerase n=1 Tax=Sphingomicrobium flavum TaxID=1229164 RepID=UPI0021AE055D|nr:FKBP-type peptidyl-prolyl cis-trans isomerase [Sphingomicrobium flavum]
MSATQVPLRPIAKGSVAKLWLGLIALVLVGVGVAWAGTKPLERLDALSVEATTEGTGEPITLEDGALVVYEGRLKDGTVFDSSNGEAVPMLPTRVIPGFRDALVQMREGGTYEIAIPGAQAYGAEPPEGSGFKPNEDLYFTVTIQKIERDVMRQLQQLQQMPQLPPEAAPAG